MTNYPGNRWLTKLRAGLARAGIAWRFLLNRTTAADADVLDYEAMHILGVYPLECLTAENVYDTALNMWEPHPRLEALAKSAAREAWRRFESSGFVTDVAMSDAVDRITRHAKAEGVELVSL